MNCKLQSIKQILKNYHLDNSTNIIYSDRIAKIKPIETTKKGTIVLITATNPTISGEGKTTIAIGLADALNKISKNSTILTLRQPSIGPTLGLKGGATGFNKCQIVPANEINYGLTGDFFYLETINNLICSLVDNHIYFGNDLKIDPNKILIRRCIDLSDRSLRDIDIDISKKQKLAYHTGFDLTAATEIMAILALSKNKQDFINRINNILVAYTYNNKPVYVKDLKINDNLGILVDKIIYPNALSTLNNTLCLMHAGPFANIACGYNSLIALNTSLAKAKYVVTEAGFGADLGCEKFIDIISRLNNTQPSSVVICTTIKSLLNHGKVSEDKISQLCSGLTNLQQHIDFIKSINLKPVVAINCFKDDNLALLSYLVNYLTKTNIPYAKVNPATNEGFIDLAKVVIANISHSKIKYVYDLNDGLNTKITKIAKQVYGINNKIIYSPLAKKQVNFINKKAKGFYLCMAKTPYSLSSDKNNLVKSKTDKIKIDNFRINYGAKLIVALTESIFTMPGLPNNPNATKK